MNHLKTGNSYFGAGSYVKYKFGGKELQETGMYDFGARMYMADIGRWFAADPMAEVHTDLTPYRYGFNNPVMFTDPNGMLEDAALEKMWSIGGEWKNNGNEGFDYGKHTVDYTGNYSFNPIDVDIEEVIMKGKGNKETWNNSLNFGYNQFVIHSKIMGALSDWNYDVNSSNMGQYILNSKASREVAEFEKFLFLELPASFAGGELLSLGWRASGIGKVLASQANKIFTVASSGGGETLPMTIEKIIPKGTKIADVINEIKGLTWSTGNEHAVVKLANGQKAIVSGGPGGISFEAGQIRTLFGHTHPTAAPPSAADFRALKILNQAKQYVFHGGETTLIRP